MDYSNLGLDSNLRPVNSPVVNNGQDTLGNMEFDSSLDHSSITTSQVRYISADRVAAGTIVVGLNIGAAGNGYLLLDGANNRIIVNDGTNDRVLLGYQSAGF